MHRASASSRAAGRASEQLGHQFARRHSFGQRVTVSAMRAEDRIDRSEMRADAGRDGLLTDVRVAGPVDETALMTARQFLFRLTDDEHRAVEEERSRQ